jgi:hypothetical protein
MHWLSVAVARGHPYPPLTLGSRTEFGKEPLGPPRRASTGVGNALDIALKEPPHFACNVLNGAIRSVTCNVSQRPLPPTLLPFSSYLQFESYAYPFDAG